MKIKLEIFTDTYIDARQISISVINGVKQRLGRGYYDPVEDEEDQLYIQHVIEEVDLLIGRMLSTAEIKLVLDDSLLASSSLEDIQLLERTMLALAVLIQKKQEGG